MLFTHWRNCIGDGRILWILRIFRDNLLTYHPWAGIDKITGVCRIRNSSDQNNTAYSARIVRGVPDGVCRCHTEQKSDLGGSMPRVNYKCPLVGLCTTGYVIHILIILVRATSPFVVTDQRYTYDRRQIKGDNSDICDRSETKGDHYWQMRWRYLFVCQELTDHRHKNVS